MSAAGGGDVDPVEIMLNALADAEADVRNGLYERGNAFSRLAQAAALTAIATSQRLESAENRLAKVENRLAKARQIAADLLAREEQEAQEATDRTKDGHHHVWLSDDRCVTPRCRAVNGAFAVAEATS